MVTRVCLVSGGTGGHLVPALVLARALRERGHATVLVTEGRPVERALLEREQLASGQQPTGLDELDLVLHRLLEQRLGRRVLACLSHPRPVIQELLARLG